MLTEHNNLLVPLPPYLLKNPLKNQTTHWSGRTTQNTVVVFPKESYNVGDFVRVEIVDATAATLIGKPLGLSDEI